MTVIDSTFLTNHSSHFNGAALVDLHTVDAQHTLLAPALYFKIALLAVRAMASVFHGTVYAKLGSVGIRAIFIVVHTFAAPTALSANVYSVAIALPAVGTMALPLIYSAIKAKAISEVGGACRVYFYTLRAQTALLAPISRNEIAGFTVGTVGALLISAL